MAIAKWIIFLTYNEKYSINNLQTPLEESSVDMVVFCLALMGTNLLDYMKEANRILKSK